MPNLKELSKASGGIKRVESEDNAPCKIVLEGCHKSVFHRLPMDLKYMYVVSC